MASSLTCSSPSRESTGNLFSFLYQLDPQKLSCFLKYLNEKGLATVKKISMSWYIKCIISEPFIKHDFNSDFSFTISARCKIPAPVYHLGPAYQLKKHELLDPKKCFSISVIAKNGRVFDFKLLKFNYATRHQLINQHLSKLMTMFLTIPKIHQTYILQCLDEITLYSKIALVSKAWNWKVKLHPFPNIEELKSLCLEFKYMYGWWMKISIVSSKRRKCRVAVKGLPTWKKQHTFRFTPEPGEALLSAFKAKLPKFIDDAYKADEKESRERSELEVRFD